MAAGLDELRLRIPLHQQRWPNRSRARPSSDRQARCRDAPAPAQLAFELNALAQGANWAYQLLGNKGAFAQTRIAMLARLRALAT